MAPNSRQANVPWMMLLLALFSCFQQATPVLAQSLSIDFLRRPDGSLEPNVSLSGPMQEVQGIIKGLHKLSSCNKIATAHLLESCSTLPDPADPRSTDMIMDNPKRIYVARLALCEISEAPGAKWPRGCLALDLSHRNDKISEQSVDHCVNDLYFATTSNMWTSYSSAKKHAAGICQSVRAGIEKDEQIRAFETLFNATAAVSQELNDSKEQIVAMRDAFSLLRLGLFEFLDDVRTQYNEIVASGQKNWQEAEIHTQSITASLGGILQQLQKVSEDLAHHDELVQSMATQIEHTHSTELVKIKENADAVQARIMLTMQIALDGAEQVSARTMQSLGAAGGLSSELVLALSDHLSRINDAAEAVEEITTDIADIRKNIALTKAEQETSLSEFQISLNRTTDFLQHMSPLSGILSTIGLPPQFFDVHLPLFISLMLFIFAILYGRCGLSIATSVATAMASSILVRLMCTHWKRHLVLQIEQIALSERVIWGSTMAAFLVASSFRKIAKILLPTRWQTVQQREDDHHLSAGQQDFDRYA